MISQAKLGDANARKSQGCSSRILFSMATPILRIAALHWQLSPSGSKRDIVRFHTITWAPLG
jgi:hypothetical protein